MKGQAKNREGCAAALSSVGLRSDDLCFGATWPNEGGKISPRLGLVKDK